VSVSRSDKQHINHPCIKEQQQQQQQQNKTPLTSNAL
jgi:hypothetical protein